MYGLVQVVNMHISSYNVHDDDDAIGAAGYPHVIRMIMMMIMRKRRGE